MRLQDKVQSNLQCFQHQKVPFKDIPINNRFFFLKNIEANTGRITHPGKLELVARSTSEEFILKIPKQFED